MVSVADADCAVTGIAGQPHHPPDREEWALLHGPGWHPESWRQLTASQKLCSLGIPSFLLPWTSSFGEAVKAPEAPQVAWTLPGGPLGAPSLSVLWAPEPSESWWHRSCGTYAGSALSPRFMGRGIFRAVASVLMT